MNKNRLFLAAGIIPAFLCSSAIAVTPANSVAAAQARDQLNAHTKIAHAGKSDSFSLRDVIEDRNGAVHVRFDRSYAGLPVIGGDLVVHLTRNGQWTGISQTLSQRVQVNVRPQVSKDLAIRVAESAFEGQVDEQTTASPVIYARGGAPVLAWDTLVGGIGVDSAESHRHVIVDAGTGKILEQWSEEQTTASTGTGESLYAGLVSLTTDSSGSSYVLRDPTRGNHYACNMRNTSRLSCKTYTDSDNVWGDYTNSNSQSAAVDAVYGQNLTWDFYLTNFNRDGIANDGNGAYSRVHYSRNYVNAYWSDSCFCMTYGDGDGSTYLPLVSIDVAGHEMTHGVTSRTAGLVYSGESGGLNEATSDIFGTLVEFSANNSSEVPNYLIGERIYSKNSGVPYPTTALRYMFKPSIDGISPDCYYSGIGSLDVHYSSGIANHFFYLLTQGAVAPQGFSLTPSQLVCNGNTNLTAIPRSEAAQIMYRALTVYYTSSTTYSAARVATLNAAADLYGSTSTEYAAVAAAWSAVSVN